MINKYYKMPKYTNEEWIENFKKVHGINISMTKLTAIIGTKKAKSKLYAQHTENFGLLHATISKDKGAENVWV